MSAVLSSAAFIRYLGSCVAFVFHIFGFSVSTVISSKIINVYQPAGKMEEFFRELGKYNGKPNIHEALLIDEFRLFHNHGMELLGPPCWEIGKLRKAGE